MKKSVKRRWVKALESGKYKQTRSKLAEAGENKTKPDRFCCLGVLCDVYGKSKEGKEAGFSWDSAPWGDPCPRFGDKLEDIPVLPKQIMEWAGLEDSDPIINPRTRKFTAFGEPMKSASQANDDLKLGFKRIAKLIERNL